MTKAGPSGSNDPESFETRRRRRITIVEGKPIDFVKQARKDGKEPRGDDDDRMFPTESQIIEDWQGHYRWQNEVGNHEVQNKDKRFRTNEDIPTPEDVERILGAETTKLLRKRRDQHEAFVRLRDDERRLALALQEFRSDHRIRHAASYPISKLHHYAVIFGLVIVESFANMYFFAQGNSLGLLGGFFQAILLSLISIGVAVAVGYFALRAIHHKHTSMRVMGILSLVAYLVFFVGFNLVVAHYRDLLAERPDEALAQAIPATLAAPFRITFDSLMLIVASLLAAALGGYKGYTSEDRYPGHGKLDRKAHGARLLFDNAKTTMRAEVHAILDATDAELVAIREHGEAMLAALDGIIAEGEKHKESYERGLEDTRSDCRQWLIDYRNEFMKVRGVPTPPHFAKFEEFEYALDVQTMQVWIPRRDEAVKKHAALVAKLEGLDAEKKGSVQRITRAQQELDDYFEQKLGGEWSDDRDLAHA